jgi:16S rRNA (cytosine1402-N4)-methyltransferase
MLHEMLENLDIRDGRSYLDCTFGAGGYSRAILSKANLSKANAQLTALDRDSNVKATADEVAKSYPNNFTFHQGNFSEASKLLGGQKFDGIVMDLGVSSMQIDIRERGFSFQSDGPLDMRMDQSSPISAFEVVNEMEEEDLANIIYKYGDEPKSRHIARAIAEKRQACAINTTLELASTIKSVTGYGRKYGKYRTKIDPATKTFQAIRIHVNEELKSLELFLGGLKHIVNPGARIVIVSFHALEDVIVKNFFKEHGLKKVAKSKYSTREDEPQEGKWLEALTKKPLVPSKEEVSENIRSRSARMRVCRVIGGEV